MKSNFLPSPSYKYITKTDDVWEVLERVSKSSFVEVDTEGTSLDPYTCKTTLLQLGIPGEVYIFDLRCDLPVSDIHGSVFKKFLTSNEQLKILQNCVYDMKVLKVQFGYYINNIYDTMIAEMLLTLGIQNRGFSLADLVYKYLKLTMDKEPRSTFTSYEQKFTEKQLKYAALDVCTLNIIKEHQMVNIRKYNLENVLKLEMDFCVPLCEMELNGIKVDISRWNRLLEITKKELVIVKKNIEDKLSGVQSQISLFDEVSMVSIDSPVQLKNSLNLLGYNIDSTSQEVLSKLKNDPLIKDILNYRERSKLVSTYGDALLDLINTTTNRLHTNFNQMVSTGRLSSRNPNLQNIPSKQLWRSCFIAEENNVLITVDQNSAELVIMGCLSDEPNFLNAYKNKLDLHTVNASRIFNVPYDKVTHKQRTASKAISFGLCLDENTYVFTNEGIKYIKDVKRGQRIFGNLHDDEVVDVIYTGERDGIQIILENGLEIISTAEHRFKVSSEGALVTKTLWDIIENNYKIRVFAGNFMDSSYNSRCLVFSNDLPVPWSYKNRKILGTFKYKYVPICIKESSRKYQKQFIKFLFLYQTNNFVLYSKYKKFLLELQLMLLNFSIFTTIHNNALYIDEDSIELFNYNIMSKLDEFKLPLRYKDLCIVDNIYKPKIKVYDLLIDKDPYFIANGLIAHNCYGISGTGLAKRLGITPESADDLIQRFFLVNPVLQQWLDRTAKETVKFGYSETVTGRKRFYDIPHYSSPDRKKIVSAIQRAGKNHAVQGSDADTIKLAMIKCVRELKKLPYKARLILSVHDEIVVEAPYEHRFEVAEIATKAVNDGFNEFFSKMPMYTDAVIGPCWIKKECENILDSGDECKYNEMKFVKDEKYLHKLVCCKCGADQE